MDYKRKEKKMVKKNWFLGMLVMVLTIGLSDCTSTNYFSIVTEHTATEVVSDNVQVFEGASYDAAVVKAGEAGFEVILSYEGRNQQGPFGWGGKVRVLAKDADGIRPAAATPADSVETDASAVDSEVEEQ
jgi:hypothetical protein